MTQLRSFQHYCTCGGYARQINGRPEAQPHMNWCPQYKEYAEWWAQKEANDSQRNSQNG